MKISDTINRIKFIKQNNQLCYIMRDISCFSHEYKNFYTDIASYCNQPNIYKKMSFKQFLLKRHDNNLERIETSLFLLMKKD